MASSHEHIFDRLERKTEEILKQQNNGELDTSSDVLDLVHQVKIQQAELEVQNEELIRAQDEIASLHREYSDLYEFAPCGYLVLTRNGVITRINLSGAELLGKERSNLTGMPLSSFLASECKHPYFALLEQVGTTGENQSLEIKLQRSNEEVVWVQTDIQVDYDTTGTINQYRLTMTDITKRKQTENQFEKVVQLSPIGVGIVDKAGNMAECNTAFTKLVGYSREELLRMNFEDFTHPEDLTRERELIRELWVGQKVEYRMEKRYIHKKGHTIWVLVTASLFMDLSGELEFGFAFVQDISERRQTEAQVRKMNADLESRINERTAELEKQRLISLRADRLRSLGEMAAGIAHELNQPLVGVRGLAEHLVLAKKRGWLLKEERLLENLQGIIDQADRMTHVIQHIRLFSREAGKEETQLVDINEVVENSMVILKEQIRSRGIEVKQKPTLSIPPVTANLFSLEEVVRNIIVNARDAVEERMSQGDDQAVTHEILLETGTSGRGNRRDVVLEIRDTGGGISRDMQKKVFEPFFTTKSLEKGTGLGLAISKNIIESFGGTISLHSQPGRGTTVTITLPAVGKTP